MARCKARCQINLNLASNNSPVVGRDSTDPNENRTRVGSFGCANQRDFGGQDNLPIGKIIEITNDVTPGSS
jgi:hypothetical protein